jgi:hypothetical protein
VPFLFLERLMTSDTTKPLITFRIPRKVIDEVRRIALVEQETQSSILRRLLRRGLAEEHRGGGNEA